MAEFITGTTIAGDVSGTSTGRCTTPARLPARRRRAALDRLEPAPTNARFQPADQAGLTAADHPAARAEMGLRISRRLGRLGATDRGRRARVRRQPERHRLRARREDRLHPLDVQRARAACGPRSRSAAARRAHRVYFGDTAANVYALDADTGGSCGRARSTSIRSRASPARRRSTRAGSTCRCRRTRRRRAPTRSTAAARSAAASPRSTRRPARWSGRRHTIAERAAAPRHEHGRRAAVGTVGRGGLVGADRRPGATRARTSRPATPTAGRRSRRATRWWRSTSTPARSEWMQQVTPNDVYSDRLPAGNPELSRRQRSRHRFRQPADARAARRGARPDRHRTEVGRSAMRWTPSKRGEVVWQYRAGRGGAARRHRVGIGGGRRPRLLRACRTSRHPTRRAACGGARRPASGCG